MSNKEMLNEHFSSSNGFGEHKNIAVSLLKNLITLLDKYQVYNCLISGTLLGYCRHNDFIPWDDDIDILVSPYFITQLDKIILELNLEKTFKIYTQNDKYLYKFSYVDKIISHNKGTYFWPFIDLFVYNCSDNKKINFFNKNWNLHQFFPCSQVSFNEINVNIPKNPHYFLYLNYGANYMETYVSSTWNHKKERSKKTAKITNNDYNEYFNLDHLDK